MNQHRSALNIVFYLICFGIVYGSLFPFQFALVPDRAVVDHFLLSWRTVTGLGDILGNIALFMPFGLLAHLLWKLPGPGYGNTRYFVLLWLLVAVGSQLLQFFVPGRDPSIFDLYCNAGGAALGWALLRFLPEKTAAGLASVSLPRQISILLPLLWLAAELIPFVPTIDFQAYKNGIKPLLLYPQWLWYDAVLQASCWIVCFYLLDRCAGISLPLRRLLPGVLAVIFLKIVIVKNSVSVTDVVAITVALAAWLALRERHIRPRVLAYVLLLSVVIGSLFPFLPRSTSAAFGWIPFSGFLQGSMLANATALCQKLFVFGSLVFLTQQPDKGWKRRSLLIALLLALLEFVQLWVASGTPEMTDPVLFLGIAWLYSSIVKQGNAAGGPGGLTLPIKQVGNKPSLAQAAPGFHGRKSVAIIVAVYCALTILSLQAILSIKGVPYNVRDLFGGRGDVFDFLFFSLALLSIGWGSAWLGRVLASTHRPSLAVPVALLKLVVVIYFFMWLSVSGESLRDILGANVFDRQLQDEAVSGRFGIGLVSYFGIDSVRGVTDFFEPIVRFFALLGPALMMAACSLAIMQRGTWQSARQWTSSKSFVVACLWLLPWLYICKHVAFDWAATDNLTELIARESNWGVSGGAYLYVLVMALMSLSALVCWGYFRKTKGLLVSFGVVVASLPITWFLLNQGLEHNIFKYGRSFSAVNFLLGPDRQGVIGAPELFLRWSLVQLILVAGVAFGAILYLRWSMLTAPVESPADPGSTPLKFRVYGDQWGFLHAQAETMNISVNDLVQSIIAYFGREIAASPDTIAVVRGYLDKSRAGEEVSLAPDRINVELTPEAREVLDAIDPAAVHSESRIFRKLLQIFMAVASEQSDKA